MSRQYLIKTIPLVFVLCAVIGLTACSGGGGGNGSNPPPPATPTPPPTQISQVKITWQNSYVYPHPGTNKPYWYAQVVYQNTGNTVVPINCTGRFDPSYAKEHISGTSNDDVFNAIETLCSVNPDSNYHRDLEPGGYHYEYAIFDQVPAGGQVALEWGSYGVSQAVNPWASSPYPPNTPHPTVCPSLGACQSQFPEGRAQNLIVLVHGCCTTAQGVYEWRGLADAMIGEILKTQNPDAWEIVVWDWSNFTTPSNLLCPLCSFLADASAAYQNAKGRGDALATAILNPILNVNNRYEYVHLIGHSAGAKLIDTVATDLLAKSVETGHKPFIHLTFLDAFTHPLHADELTYGGNADYAEHYVDRSPGSIFASTDACLSNAFNFNITDWKGGTDGKVDPYKGDPSGHQWPRYWYEQSVTTRSQTPSQILTFPYGYPLSFEGGHDTYTALSGMYPDHLQCHLMNLSTQCNPPIPPKPADTAYQCW